MAGVYTQKFGMDFIELEAEIRQPFAHDGIRCARFLERLGPTVDQGSSGLPAVGETDRDLQHLRSWGAPNSENAYSIRAPIFETYVRNIGDTIGRDVVAWIAELIEQLLLDDVGVHTAAGSWVLGDTERAVGLRLDNRIPDVRHV